MFLVVFLGVVGWILRAYVLPPGQYGGIVKPESRIVDVQIATGRPTFSGTVVDAQTQKNVDEFAVMVGYRYPNDPTVIYNPMPQGRSLFSGGQYTVSQVMGLPPNAQWFLYVEARGYLPSVSAAQTRSGTVNFQLAPGNDIVGHVFGIDGNPAGNVSLAAAILGASNVSVQSGGKLSVLSGIVATSESDGSYDLPPQTGQFLIVACSQDGYAQVNQDDIGKSTDIHLQPWGGVQGRVMLGNKPAAGNTIMVTSGGDPRVRPSVSAYATVKTDADGRFAVGRVRPGTVNVTRSVPPHVDAQGHMSGGFTTPATQAVVKSGETTTVVLGGAGGREVVGKLIIPDSYSPYRYRIFGGVTSTDNTPVIPQMPDRVKNGTPDERLTWLQRYANSPVGSPYTRDHPEDAPPKTSNYLEFGDNNMFRIEGVEPGNYHIAISITVPFGNGDGQTVEAAATFAMPPITPDVADQPLQIPDITVTTMLHPQSASAARNPAAARASAVTFGGTVVDATTHQPIDGFLAIAGYGPDTTRPSDYITNANQPTTPFTGGQYTLSPSPTYVSGNSHWFVRVEARGYLPAVSAAQDRSATVNFAMTPGADIVGHIYGIDGKPAGNVTLAAALPGLMNVQLRGGGLTNRAGMIATSGPDGAYDLPPQTGDFLIVAISPDGYAQANQDDIAKSPDIHLLAFGRVEGRVQFVGKPAAGQSIVVGAPVPDRAHGPSQPLAWFSFNGQTDADGHFAFAKVPPVAVRIFRRFDETMEPQYPRVHITGITQNRQMTLQPGKTVAADFDGGREVVVKVNFPDNVSNGLFLFSSNVTRVPAAPALPTYTLEYSDGNTFHIEGVEPGDYQLQVLLRGTGGAPGTQYSGAAQATFTMPPITPDLANQPLVIPDVTVTAK
jgi:hypothetical protein